MPRLATIRIIVADDPSGDTHPHLRLTEHRPELEAQLRDHTLRWFANDALAVELDIAPGSAVVSFALVSSVATTIGTVAAQLDSLLAASMDTIRALANAQPWQVSGSWTPSQSLSAASAAAVVPSEPGSTQLGKWLLTAGAFAIAALGVLKIGDADLTRVRLNHPYLVSAMLTVIVVATLLGVLWPAWANRGTTTRFTMLLLTVAVAAVGAAVCGIAVLASEALSSGSKPRISSVLKNENGVTRLVGTVAEDGIKDVQSLHVAVISGGDTCSSSDANSSSTAQPAPSKIKLSRGVTRTGQMLYDGQSGADRDGKAELALDVLIPPRKRSEVVVLAGAAEEEGGVLDCKKQNVGHARFIMPPPAGRPHLVASWKTPLTSPPVLSVHVTAAGLRTGHGLRLIVTRPTKPGHFGPRIYFAAITADANEVDHTVEVPIKGKRRVCVIAKNVGVAAAISSKPGKCTQNAPGVAAALLALL